jgi:hypothetical protein
MLTKPKRSVTAIFALAETDIFVPYVTSQYTILENMEKFVTWPPCGGQTIYRDICKTAAGCVHQRYFNSDQIEL